VEHLQACLFGIISRDNVYLNLIILLGTGNKKSYYSSPNNSPEKDNKPELIKLECWFTGGLLDLIFIEAAVIIILLTHKTVEINLIKEPQTH
jgi:hypothetical protein